MFLTTLYYLLLQPKNPVESMSDVTKVIDRSNVLQSSIEKAIKSIFLFTFKMFSFHFVFTWLTFSFFDVEMTYLASLVSGIVAIVPIASPFYVVIPATMAFYFQGFFPDLKVSPLNSKVFRFSLQGYPFSALVLLLLHLFVYLVVDPLIFADIPDSHRK